MVPQSTEGLAQSLVALGVELARVTTVGDLQDALEEADRLLGLRRVEVAAQ